MGVTLPTSGSHALVAALTAGNPQGWMDGWMDGLGLMRVKKKI
jgi:hypothetical protein